MRRHLFVALLALLFPLPALGEITFAAGGGAAYDAFAAQQFSPLVDFSAVGSHSWVPLDRLGFLLDWSGGGSYEPQSSAWTGLLSATASGSYMAEGFLSRLSLSSVANPSTEDGFYGAVSAALLTSYGSPDASVYLEPRLSLIEDGGQRTELGTEAGVALLLWESLLVKPSFEAGVSVPFGTSWRMGPSAAFDWYPGGSVSAGFRLGYARSWSQTLSTLETGGRLLPLSTWNRYSLSTNLSWLPGPNVALTARLPADYYLKSYDAYEGGTDLGVATWLVHLAPALDLKLMLSDLADLVLSVQGAVDLSNNEAERATALSSVARVEIHLR